jgi:hypothetical protein
MGTEAVPRAPIPAYIRAVRRADANGLFPNAEFAGILALKALYVAVFDHRPRHDQTSMPSTRKPRRPPRGRRA